MEACGGSRSMQHKDGVGRDAQRGTGNATGTGAGKKTISQQPTGQKAWAYRQTVRAAGKRRELAP